MSGGNTYAIIYAELLWGQRPLDRRIVLKRTDVLLSPDAMARQREFTEKIAAHHRTLDHRPLALVDTFGCPLV